jgi:ergothioneine biosynthesis protein EgtB
MSGRYRAFDPRYGYLFNSYYESQGPRSLREKRGNLSRPTVEQVLAYRSHVDAKMSEVMASPLGEEVLQRIELGLQHEQQHQELLLTDIKYILGANPLEPAYDDAGVGVVDVKAEHVREDSSLRREWFEFAGGEIEVGHADAGFAFDNEGPCHKVLVPGVQLRASLVTNAEFLEFMRDGGYMRYEFWHAEGWNWVQTLSERAPLYWRRDHKESNDWCHYTLSGPQTLNPDAPVTHVSLYEAYAFCQWAGWRLPSEFEWEVMATKMSWGQRWEWTGSAYLPYPGFKAFRGPVSEYNGKFMLNQMVLRGASFATAPGHARSTYRNFFPPQDRWQYTGIRPARDWPA